MAGRYRLHDVLGRGGMGEVYRATDDVLGRSVAVKVMRPVDETLACPERFLREARASARIVSPHVVATYDFGRDGDLYFLAMELVQGGSVADELRTNGPFSSERALDVVRQAAAGLTAAHALGMVHRDVKASNLALSDDGTVKLADFGIVRFLDDAPTTMTSNGQIVGTSLYLSPECALGEPAEPAGDVYALGCLLYQLVAGHPPFMGDSPSSIMYQHVHADPVPPSGLRPQLTSEVEALIFWMLEKDPSRRPTAAQVAAGAQPPHLAGDLDTTVVLSPVRRRTSKSLLAGAVAAFVLAAVVAVGIALDTRGVELPATTELGPTQSRSVAPEVKPRVTPTPTRTSTPAVTSRPEHRSSPAIGATKRAPKSKVSPGHGKGAPKSKHDKPRAGKPRKPKA
ncbi:serine/threonine-protein kinase [Kribbella sp. VKM Ac-2571]|uniref:serine/threonine-protein kinase n=1 Tax=Kribbella sp. VKM Ac-2571 TaxID=2512222 RepID=UPI0010619AC9|nr:serine/threonine-protein kinase [Kribbella sp. VKM Ac-2571]TDO66528.1 serine/threonine-protein kinase [Kribbella sp. VKM Ac-2571]